MVTVNFADTGDLEFGSIPPGKYHVCVTEGELRESGPNAKNPGSQYINWELTIQEGACEGRKLWTNTSLLPQALFGLKALLLASGRWTKEQLADDMDFEINDVMGAKVVATVANREYQGETRNEVKRFHPYDPAKFSATSATDLLP